MLWLDTRISLFYQDYYSLYNFILFVCILIWFVLVWKLILEDKRQKLNELIGYLVEKETEKSFEYAIYLKDIHNFIWVLFWFLFLFMILAVFLVFLKEEYIFYKVIYLWFYFSIVISAVLTYQMVIDFVETKIEKKDL